MTPQPLSHCITRIFLALLFTVVFLGFLVANMLRLVYSPDNSVSERIIKEVPLPSFGVYPPNNSTVLDNVSCVLVQHNIFENANTSPTKPLDEFYKQYREAGTYNQERRKEASELYQLAKDRNALPANATADPTAATLTLLKWLDDNHVDSNSTGFVHPGRHLYYFEELRDLLVNGRFSDRILSQDRWSTYQMNSHYGQKAPVYTQVVCRVGNLTQITLSPTNATEVVRGGPATNNTHLASIHDPFTYEEQQQVTVQKGQHTTMTYQVSAIDFPRCALGIFCLGYWSDYDHELHSVLSAPTQDSRFIPSSLLDGINPDDYGFFTIRFNLKYFNGLVVQVTTRHRGYSWLEVLASIMSAFCYLYLLYQSFMGDFKVQPLGLVQRYIFRGATREYVEAIKAQEGDKQENVLYGLYLSDKGVKNV